MGRLKDYDKNKIDLNDPDYIKKDRERIFNELKEKDRNRMKEREDRKMHEKFFDSEDSFEDYCPLC